jgi:alkyl sulfatase BDS1-like metallo-beta-lactamase superfamily hydrolase
MPASKGQDPVAKGTIAAVLLASATVLAGEPAAPASRSPESQPASAATVKLLREAAQALPIGDFSDGSLFADHAQETLIAPLPDGIGPVSAEQQRYFQGEPPDTVHPSTLRYLKTSLNDSGLYQLAEGVYQIRGDLTQITMVRGRRGWIVIDPGLTREFAEEAFAFAKQHLPGGAAVPVSAVIYSHSHADHFGGVKGFVSQAQVNRGDVEIIAPWGFMREAVSENILAGTAMGRRSEYHFGANLALTPDGRQRMSANFKSGTFTLIAPTIELPQGPGAVTDRVVDGVPLQFMDISGAEAPAATLIYLPGQELLFNSELFYVGLHNIYTLRGAKVRDALYWSKLIGQIIQRWGQTVQSTTGPHGPSFAGNAQINEYLRIQRDNYGFLHNQTVRLMNQGVPIGDIGERVAALVPDSLSRYWHTHGYHGTYSHNARGVASRYLGFYDGNPANLNPLPRAVEAQKLVAYMGGARAILKRARRDYNQGNYRIVATVLDKLAWAEPGNDRARALLADSYEQLGYQSEGPQWRNAYLSAARELRTGHIVSSSTPARRRADLINAATAEQMLDAVAARLNSAKAKGQAWTLSFEFPDTQQSFLLELANANLSSIETQEPAAADATVIIAKANLPLLFAGARKALKAAGGVKIEGDPRILQRLAALLEPANPTFPLVPTNCSHCNEPLRRTLW